MSTVEIEFDEASHVYRLGGAIVPSVTQVLGILNDFSQVPAGRLEAARDFGVNVHAAVNLYNRGDLDMASLDPALAPYLAQWEHFLSQSGFIVTGSEQRVHNARLGYAGTADVIGSWQNSSWVLDIKTGWVPRTVGAQLAAYQAALEPRPRRRLCVRLMPEDYRLHECKGLSDFALFQSALNIWKFQHAA